MPLDKVHIIDLSVTGIIGIKPDERVNPQEVLVNATMWVDTSPAARSDDIQDAANYRTIGKAIIAHIEQGKPMLVERLVQEIADLIFATEARVQEVEVRVEKPGALRHAKSVGISIHRSRVVPDDH
jgi:dihydroneopterin aldolase/D-erythro-7,8-dihydroneopterin triphosphate epimerase